MAVDGFGIIYVTEMNNNRVQKFDRNGKHFLNFGPGEPSPDALGEGSRVAVDAAGDVYLADTFNQRVVKLDMLRNFLFSFGFRGKADG